MSGTSSPGPAPDALELAALLCSRVCHDLISPVGAIVNGLEVLDDNPKPEDRDFALDLIRKSAKTASARLQFCRLAFGAAGSAERADRSRRRADHGDAAISRTARSRIALEFAAAAAAEEPGQAAAEHADHRAADDSARRHADDRSGRRRRDDELSRHGGRAECPRAAKYRRAARARSRPPAIDAHAVQPYYTRLLAQACGLTVTLVARRAKTVVDQRRPETRCRGAKLVNRGFTDRRPDSMLPLLSLC